MKILVILGHPKAGTLEGLRDKCRLKLAAFYSVDTYYIADNTG